ncbi:MAG: hypothetical protein JW920_05580 [Deltaproteobacteria bacterium]|nr:hypothetical protein [Deltaproteobacteria bacterium]
MINKRTIIPGLAGIVLILMFLLPTGRAMEESKAGSLVTKTCAACHSTERICKKLDKQDRKWWNKTAERMIKRGADLTPEQKDLIVQYLVDLAPGSEPVCH